MDDLVRRFAAFGLHYNDFVRHRFSNWPQRMRIAAFARNLLSLWHRDDLVFDHRLLSSQTHGDGDFTILKRDFWNTAVAHDFKKPLMLVEGRSVVIARV